MAEITAALVKELREKSGAGMMDCKAALNEAKGDMEAAVDWLRKKGLAAAAKKSGRIAAEGLVAVATDGTSGAVIELNAETDFVARNDIFQGFAAKLAAIALEGSGDIEDLKAAPIGGHSVADEVTAKIAAIGENMNLRRSARLEVSEGAVVSYVHNALKPGLGKIGVLVGLVSTGDKDKLEALGRQIAMHVAAARPESLTTDELDPALIERERAVLLDKAKASGKAADIIEKMIQGQLNKFYKDVVLLEQAYVINPDLTVAKALAEAGKELGAPVTIAGFVRFELGEGIEKKQEDFAAEVAAQLAS